MIESRTLAELKIPADPDFIPVAKRVASGLGSLLGFTLEGIDEINIAVTQICDTAIDQALEIWGSGELKLEFLSTERGIEFVAEALAPRARAPVAPRQPRGGDAEGRRLTHEMIRCFVDDFRANVEPSRVRIWMVKYLIS